MWLFTVKNALITEVCQFLIIYAYKSTIFVSHFISHLHRRCGDARFVGLAPVYKRVSKHPVCFVTRKLFFSVAHHPNLGLSRLNVEVSKSHTHTHPVRLL